MFFCHNKKKLSAWTSSGCFPRSLRSWLKELGAQGLDLIELGSKSGPKSRESRGDFVGFGKLEVWAPGPIQRILREVLIKYLFFWGGRRGGGKIQVIYKGLWEFPTFWDIDFSTTRGEVDFFRRRWGPKFLMNPQNLWTWHFSGKWILELELLGVKWSEYVDWKATILTLLTWSFFDAG